MSFFLEHMHAAQMFLLEVHTERSESLSFSDELLSFQGITRTLATPGHHILNQLHEAGEEGTQRGDYHRETKDIG